MQFPTTIVHPDAQMFGAKDEEHFSEAYRRYSDVQITTKLEEQEQLRRLADTTGEVYKKANAMAISKMLQDRRQPGLYERGSEYASSLLSASIQAGKNATQVVLEASHRVQDAAIRGAEATQDAVIMAQDLAHQGVEYAQALSIKSGVSNLIHGAVDKVSDMWDDVSYAFALAKLAELEELERDRRMTSDHESRAVLNAQKAASLIKELGFPFYNPTFEPNSFYGTKMLEEIERNRRIMSDSVGHVGIVNAQGVAEVVKDSVRLLKTSGHLNIPGKEHEPIVVPMPVASALSQ